MNLSTNEPENVLLAELKKLKHEVNDYYQSVQQETEKVTLPPATVQSEHINLLQDENVRIRELLNKRERDFNTELTAAREIIQNQKLTLDKLRAEWQKEKDTWLKSMQEKDTLLTKYKTQVMQQSKEDVNVQDKIRRQVEEVKRKTDQEIHLWRQRVETERLEWNHLIATLKDQNQQLKEELSQEEKVKQKTVHQIQEQHHTELQNQQQHTEAEKEILLNKIQVKEQEIQSLNARLVTRDAETKIALERQVQNTDTLREKTQTELKQLNNQIETLTAQWTSQLKVKQDEIDLLRTEIQEKEETVRKIQTMYEEEVKTRNEWERKINRQLAEKDLLLRQEIENKQQEIQKLRNLYEQQVQEKNQELNKVNVDLTNKEKELRTEINNLQLEIMGKESQLTAERQLRNQSETESVKERRVMLDNLRQNDDKITELNNFIQQINEQSAELRDVNDRLRKEKATLQQTFTQQVTDKVNELTSKYHTEIEAKQNEILYLQTELAQLKETRERERLDAAEQFTQYKTQLETDFTNRESTLNKIQGSLQIQVQTKEAQLNDLIQELNRVKSNITETKQYYENQIINLNTEFQEQLKNVESVHLLQRQEKERDLIRIQDQLKIREENLVLLQSQLKGQEETIRHLQDKIIQTVNEGQHKLDQEQKLHQHSQTEFSQERQAWENSIFTKQNEIQDLLSSWQAEKLKVQELEHSLTEWVKKKEGWDTELVQRVESEVSRRTAILEDKLNLKIQEEERIKQALTSIQHDTEEMQINKDKDIAEAIRQTEQNMLMQQEGLIQERLSLQSQLKAQETERETYQTELKLWKQQNEEDKKVYLARINEINKEYHQYQQNTSQEMKELKDTHTIILKQKENLVISLEQKLEESEIERRKLRARTQELLQWEQKLTQKHEFLRREENLFKDERRTWESVILLKDQEIDQLQKEKEIQKTESELWLRKVEEEVYRLRTRFAQKLKEERERSKRRRQAFQRIVSLQEKELAEFKDIAQLILND